jgi:hypothetical protein
MSILQKLKNFFAATKHAEQPDLRSAMIPDFDEAAYSVAHEAYMIHYNDIASESKRFIAYYGNFNSFLSTPHFDTFLRTEVLFFREPDNQYNTFLDENHWQEKHPFNFPGPFYTGYSDTCGTGVWEAPSNVMNDANCQEYVFRQPKDFAELLQVLDAAAAEVFDSYSSNGNDYWTYEACKEWWSNRAQLIVALMDEELVRMNNGQAQAYINYLNGEAETDLRRYCYFLIHGSYPVEGTAALPSL